MKIQDLNYLESQDSDVFGGDVWIDEAIHDEEYDYPTKDTDIDLDIGDDIWGDENITDENITSDLNHLGVITPIVPIATGYVDPGYDPSSPWNDVLAYGSGCSIPSTD